MKSWLQSKTIWIAGFFEAAAIAVAFITPIAEMLPEGIGLKVMAGIVIFNNVIFQINRFFTKVGITTKKSEVTA